MADVNVKLGVDAQGAVEGFNKTTKAAEGAADATQDLGKSLEKQEARIKTLDGAINLLGGSVELLAGGLAATGLVTKENAEEFQTATLAAIAFADGSKRVLDGYKSLSEGLKAYGGISGVATKATKALNAAIRANPAVAIAVGVAALTAAIYAYVTSTSAAEKAEIAYFDAQKKVLEGQGLQLTREYELAKARGESVDKLYELELQTYENAKAEQQLERQRLQAQQRREGWSSELAAEINATQDAMEEIDFQRTLATERYNKLKRDEAEANAKAEEEKTAKEKEEAAKRAQDRKDAREKEMQEAFDFYIRMLKLAREKTKEAEKVFLDALTKQNEESFNQTTKNMEARMKASTQTVGRISTQGQMSALEVASANLFAYAELAELTAGDSVQAFGQLFSALAEVTGEGNEEAFERGKKFKIAEVVTSAIQASFQAFGAAQQFGPVLGPILGAAQVAAIATASGRAIQDIRSSTFESDSAPNLSTPSVNAGGGTTAPRGISNSFAPGGFLAPGVGTPTINAPAQPIQAYVLASDVTTGVQAYGQISRRRRFG